MKLSEIADPPGYGINLGQVLDYLMLLVRSAWVTLGSAHLMGIGAAMFAVWCLFALALYLVFKAFNQRRLRRKRTWMTDQEVWQRLNRNVADVVQDAVDDEMSKGYLTKKQASDYLRRMAKAMKSKELQPKVRERGPLTAGYQQRLINVIRNRLSSALYKTADGLRATAKIPGDPPPVIEPKPKRQARNKLEARLLGVK